MKERRLGLSPTWHKFILKSTLQRKWRCKYRVISFFFSHGKLFSDYCNSHDFDMLIAVSAVAAVVKPEEPLV